MLSPVLTGWLTTNLLATSSNASTSRARPGLWWRRSSPSYSRRSPRFSRRGMLFVWFSLSHLLRLLRRGGGQEPKLTLSLSLSLSFRSTTSFFFRARARTPQVPRQEVGPDPSRGLGRDALVALGFRKWRTTTTTTRTTKTSLSLVLTFPALFIFTYRSSGCARRSALPAAPAPWSSPCASSSPPL